MKSKVSKSNRNPKMYYHKPIMGFLRPSPKVIATLTHFYNQFYLECVHLSTVHKCKNGSMQLLMFVSSQLRNALHRIRKRKWKSKEAAKNEHKGLFSRLLFCHSMFVLVLHILYNRYFATWSAFLSISPYSCLFCLFFELSVRKAN